MIVDFFSLPYPYRGFGINFIQICYESCPSRFFNCINFAQSISSKDDGNPCYFDELGVKRYAYHPDHENLSRCVDIDSPHLCLGCGACFLMDSKVKRNRCPECKSPKVKSQFTLEECVCPYSKKRIFLISFGWVVIS
jgi:hypothetical protein